MQPIFLLSSKCKCFSHILLKTRHSFFFHRVRMSFNRAWRELFQRASSADFQNAYATFFSTSAIKRGRGGGRGTFFSRGFVLQLYAIGVSADRILRLTCDFTDKIKNRETKRFTNHRASDLWNTTGKKVKEKEKGSAETATKLDVI